VNGWLYAASALTLGLAPLIWLIWKQPPIDGLAAFQLASSIVTGILVLLCEGVSRPEFADLALALPLLSLGGSLVFARFLERWV
jgi:multicomponent Na+:H+ antiporter subunit F